jgi:hypothetical protein
MTVEAKIKVITAGLCLTGPPEREIYQTAKRTKVGLTRTAVIQR